MQGNEDPRFSSRQQGPRAAGLGRNRGGCGRGAREWWRSRVILMRSLSASTPLSGDQNVPFLLVRRCQLLPENFRTCFREGKRIRSSWRLAPAILPVPLAQENLGPKWPLLGYHILPPSEGICEDGARASCLELSWSSAVRERLVSQARPRFLRVWCQNLVHLEPHRTLWLGAWPPWGWGGITGSWSG